LKTVSKKFLRDPLSIENLDKVYSDILVKGKNERSDKTE
jgi:hypothetical protein